LNLERTFANQVVAMDAFCFYVWFPEITSGGDKTQKEA
jgi:hypothetical protein